MKNLLHEFFNSRSDASPLEASAQEQLEKDFAEWYDKSGDTQEGDHAEYARPSGFEEAARPLIKWMAENHHPHTSVTLDSTSAQLWEGLESIQVRDYIQD